MISYIVSAYDRPQHLACCLSSLALQQGPSEILIADNASAPEAIAAHTRLAEQFGAVRVPTGEMGAKECYGAAEMVARQAHGEWLCFPSDDSYYVPDFAATMLAAADRGKWDLVYCDMIYDPRFCGRYEVIRVEPKVGWIDKTCFLVRREKFSSFPGKSNGGPCMADGYLIEALVRAGIRHGKAPGVLVVHN